MIEHSWMNHCLFRGVRWCGNFMGSKMVTGAWNPFSFWLWLNVLLRVMMVFWLQIGWPDVKSVGSVGHKKRLLWADQNRFAVQTPLGVRRWMESILEVFGWCKAKAKLCCRSEMVLKWACWIVDVAGILLTTNPSSKCHKHHDHVMRFEPGLQTLMACSLTSCVSQACLTVHGWHRRCCCLLLLLDSFPLWWKIGFLWRDFNKWHRDFSRFSLS